MLVIHGTFHINSKNFYLWAETDSVQKRHKGRGLQVNQHPFTSAAAELREWLESVAPHTEATDTKITLCLPTIGKHPQISPELRATGVFEEEALDSIELGFWQVEALELNISNTLNLLLTLDRRDYIGSDIHFWRIAALEALALVVGQQVMPALERQGFQYHALWQPVPEQPQRLVDLASQMPDVCRAMSDSAANAVEPYKLLSAFVAITVDTTIREATQSFKLSSLRGAGAAWLKALTGANSILQLPTAEAEDLFSAWQSWANQQDVAGNQAFRIALRLDEPNEEQASSWKLNYLLQASDDPSLIIPASQIWLKHKDPYLEQRFDQPQERLLRGLAFAGRLAPPILDSLHSAAPQDATLDTQQAYHFLQETAPLLQAAGFRVLLPRWWGGKQARLTAHATVKSPQQSSKAHLTLESLLHYDYQLLLGGEAIDYDEFLRLAELKQPLVRFRGQWVLLDASQIEAGLRFFEQATAELPLQETLRMSFNGDSNPNDGIPITSIEVDSRLQTLLEALQEPDKIEVIPPAKELHAELRPYQQRGLSWLVFLWRYGLGACLADDMGLGKTLQTIAFLLHIRSTPKKMLPALVVCPSSVVGNWRREVQRFAPDLVVMTHQGAERATGKAFIKQVKAANVVLTSYPLLARDRELLESVNWSVVILDEAQNIKNSATKQAQAARTLHSDYRLAMTGTPVENRLTELWSIFHFLNPQYLGNEKSFRRHFANPIERLDDAAAANRLKRLTAPFILRRVKTDPTVINDLPEKLEMKVYTNLTKEQGTLYEAVARDVMERIENAETEGDTMSRRGLVLSLLLQLKQICNHPAHYLKDNSTLEGRSGKLVRLTEMLEEVYATDERALIFTQFAEMGELLRTHLRTHFNDEPLWLHGGTKVKERDELIRRFQAERGARLFILSLKAGGVGLNLTSANHVFHFDRWWNPAVENQATDRAFRIGQTRNVQVHKFVCAGTLEEKIDEMIESKKALAERIVGTDESWLTEMDTSSLRELISLREIGE
jgi:SNF2 family DNA or RNA helicase